MPSAGAANTPSAPSSGAGAGPANRPDPIPLELEVIATGGRPTEGNAKRDLFTEETRTVLIFENGAVIRLAAAIAVGQLVFLTNKQTNREVVTQVIRKRSFRPTSCYVELEFTEPAPDFWGMEFAASPQVAERQTSRAQEIVESAEIIGNNSGHQVIAPSALEVERLQQELESVRLELQAMRQAKLAAANSVQPPKPVALPEAPPRVDAQQPPAPAAAAKSETNSGRWWFDASAAAPPAGPFSDELVPKPKLNLAAAPAKRSSKANAASAHKTASAKSGAGKLRIALLAAALFAAAVAGAWQMKLLPGLSTQKAAAVGVPPKTLGPGKSAGAPAPASPNASQPAANASAAPATAAVADSSATPASATGSAATAPNSPSAQSAPATPAVALAKLSPSSASRLRTRPQPTETASPAAPVAASSDAPIVPPKLLNSVNPVYPPDAMRHYITGDVTIDAVIDSSGRVRSTNVLSGPAPLRPAAIDAFQQYKYAPATQDGKPVPAHVKVIIKFWFNP